MYELLIQHIIQHIAEYPLGTAGQLRTVTVPQIFEWKNLGLGVQWNG
jgi:hypothetical protein